MIEIKKLKNKINSNSKNSNNKVNNSEIINQAKKNFDKIKNLAEIIKFKI